MLRQVLKHNIFFFVRPTTHRSWRNPPYTHTNMCALLQKTEKEPRHLLIDINNKKKLDVCSTFWEKYIQFNVVNRGIKIKCLTLVIIYTLLRFCWYYFLIGTICVAHSVEIGRLLALSHFYWNEQIADRWQIVWIMIFCGKIVIKQVQTQGMLTKYSNHYITAYFSTSGNFSIVLRKINLSSCVSWCKID